GFFNLQIFLSRDLPNRGGLRRSCSIAKWSRRESCPCRAHVSLGLGSFDPAATRSSPVVVDQSSVEQFDGESDGFAASDAETRDSAPAACALERVQECDEYPGSAASDRMPEGNGSAVDIDFVGRNAELAFGDHRHDGEGLVDLEEVDLLDGPV